MYNSLESEVRDLRRAVENHGKDSQEIRDGGDGLAIGLVVGFIIFLIFI